VIRDYDRGIEQISYAHQIMEVLVEFLLAFGHLSSTLKLGFEVIRECVDTN